MTTPPAEILGSRWGRDGGFCCTLSQMLKMGSIVTVKQVRDFLKLSETRIYKLVATGEIPAFRSGDSLQFDMDEIKTMVEDVKRRMRRKGEG